MCFKKYWLGRVENSILDDDAPSSFALGLCNAVCGMKADKREGYSFNRFAEDVLECLRIWQQRGVNLISFENIKQAEERCMQIKSRHLHPAIVQKYADLFNVDHDRAMAILQDASFSPISYYER